MIARGSVRAARGDVVEIVLPGVRVGDGVSIQSQLGTVTGVVTEVRATLAVATPHGSLRGVRCGDAVSIDSRIATVPIGTALLGRIVDARCNPLDGLGPVRGRVRHVATQAPDPAHRVPIDEAFWTGIRTIDALLTIGRGARIGVFGPPGAGKSALLHALMRGAKADAVVVGLVGERGREAEEWMHAVARRMCIVCATSDRSATERIEAARITIAQACALRDRGLHVLVILDSLARYAAALREAALANGESAGRGGYPASVFARLARLTEAAGATHRGSVTLVATVLSDGDERDPVSDSARSLLDGHVQLSAELAGAGRFPAVDVPASLSRTMACVAKPAHARDAATVRRAIEILNRTRDARALGIMPVEPHALRAVAAEAELERFLRQGAAPEAPAETLSRLAGLADTLR